MAMIELSVGGAPRPGALRRVTLVLNGGRRLKGVLDGAEVEVLTRALSKGSGPAGAQFVATRKEAQFPK